MIRVGIIGVGYMGRTHCDAYDKCDTVNGLRLLTRPLSRHKAEELARENPKVISIEEDPKQFFQSDIDAVDICTPTLTHAQFIRQAIRARKAILCEKPLALSFSLCRELVDEANRAGLPFMVAQVLRFWPEYRYCKNTLEAGSLGELRSISMVRYSSAPTWAEWFSDLAKSGGALFDLHVHDIDYLRFLLGEPRRLSSLGHKKNGLAYTDIHTGLQFENGVYATAYASYDFPQATPFRMGYRALFEKGYLDYDCWQRPMLKQYEEMKERDVDLKLEPNGYESECDYFVRCVIEGKSPLLSTAESAAKTIYLLERISESADQSGKWINLSNNLTPI